MPLTDQIRSDQVSCSVVSDSAIPWTAAHQASQSITNSQSLLKFMSIETVMPSNHLILCCPLLLPSIFPSIRVFSTESVLCIRWPKYWNNILLLFNVCVYVLSHSVLSNSLWPFGQQLARFPCPWDYPGKNTGVGCMPSSRASFQPRDQTGILHVFCIAGIILYMLNYQRSP